MEIRSLSVEVDLLRGRPLGGGHRNSGPPGGDLHHPPSSPPLPANPAEKLAAAPQAEDRVSSAAEFLAGLKVRFNTLVLAEEELQKELKIASMSTC